MEKEFKQFRLLAAAVLLFYNVFALHSGFAIPDTSEKIMIGTFVLINLSLILHYLFIRIAYQSGKRMHVFYHFPLIKIGLIGLIGIVLVLILILFVPDFPDWIGAVCCMIVAGITEIASLRAKKRAEYIETLDEKIADQTVFIRSMSTASKTLMEKADSKEIKAECKKVYEAFRYSDPMSTEELIETENQIRELFSELISAVKLSDVVQVQSISSRIKQKIQERNSKLLQRK